MGFKYALMLACMAALVFGAGLAACSSRELSKTAPPSFNFGSGGAGGDGFDFGSSDGGPPGADAAGLCGNDILPALIDAPNIYFVLDTSGSMATPVKSSTRYNLVRNAAVDLVRNLGPLINVGAALFPHKATQVKPCNPGAQVFKVSQGDAYTGVDGPTTLGFRAATLVTPLGGTPTAASIAALKPTLVALPGKTIVLLATDGGPNCNMEATCTAAECIGNIEGLEGCDPNANCCAPDAPAGPGNCIDHKAVTTAIAELAAAGIPVYVVGIPGSDVYGDVLDAMAEAGGTAQAGSPKYYRVSDLANLSDVLGSIASVVISCEISLGATPPDKGLTNVYLDSQVLPLDPVNGWFWVSDTLVELRGEACDRLKSGKVKQVQVVSGCPTETAK